MAKVTRTKVKRVPDICSIFHLPPSPPTPSFSDLLSSYPMGKAILGPMVNLSFGRKYARKQVIEM